MSNASIRSESRFRLPRLPAVPTPLRAPASAVSGRVLLSVLNRSLATALADGEFDFLAERILQVQVEDIGLSWSFTLRNERLALAPDAASPHATIGGESLDLLLLASRREDPDTLFFQRRLKLGGDTELGLQVKNLLDRLELDELPRPLQFALERLGDAAAGSRS